MNEELLKALRAANRARQAGIPDQIIEAELQARVNMSLAELKRAVKNGLQESIDNPPPAITTGALLRQQAYAATLGWLDEIEGFVRAATDPDPNAETFPEAYRKAQKDVRGEIEAFQKQYPELAAGMRVTGGAGAMATAAMTLPFRAPVVAGLLGAGAGAGGLGQRDAPEGLAERAQGAAAGGLLGVGVGAGGAALPVAARGTAAAARTVLSNPLARRTMQIGAGGGLLGYLLSKL